MRELLDDLMTALTDLLQCGFASCPPETAERLKRLGARCENTGLHTGGTGMKEIGELLEELCGTLPGENVPGFGGGELEK